MAKNPIFVRSDSNFPMKKLSPLPLFAAAALFLHLAPATAQNGNWCGTDEVRRQMVEANPDLIRQEAEYENGLQAYLQARAGQRDGDDTTTYVLPLVFHILYDPTAPEDTHNVSDQAIYDQVAQLNLDYSAMNSDLDQVCCGFVPKIGDIKVKWELATKDPYGNCTNGIDRITSLRSTNAGNFSKLDPWFRQHYVNVWVIRNFPPIPGGGTLLGFSQLPGDVQDDSGSLRDGVIMIWNALSDFGFDATTLTHELGHYLSLQHTWGSTNDPTVACGDDGVLDTPETKGHNSCNTISDLHDSFCSLTVMDTSYSFADVTTVSGTFDPTPAPALIFPDSIMVDPAPHGINYSAFSSHGVSGNSTVPGAFAFNQWTTGATNGDTAFAQFTGAINTAQYYEFTVTPQLGYSAPITGIGFLVDRTVDGPRTFAVRSSVNNYATNLTASVGPADTILAVNGGSTFFFKKDTAGSPSTATVTASYSNVVDPITFRIYGWNAEDPNGSFSIDNVKVNGQFGIIENTQNFMEYSGCSHMFTKGQATRMRGALGLPASGRNNLYTADNQLYTGINGNQVSCAPSPDFYTRTPLVCPGVQVQFKANVKRATATYWNWTFEGGDPATSTDENPFVSFETPGPHDVTLTAGNDQGENTLTKSDEIRIGANYSEVNGLLDQPFNSLSDFWSWPTLNYEQNSSYWGWTDAAGHNAPGAAKLNASQTFDQVQDVFSTPTEYLHDQDILYTPTLDLSNVSNVQFSFWFAYKTRTAVAADITESLAIEYSTDCGKTWLLKDNISGGELVTAGIGDINYLPEPGDWRQLVLTMPSLIQNDHVRIRFRYTSGPYSNDLFIDDVQIGGTVGIHELAQSGGISLFPNHATDQLTVDIDMASASSAELSILDMTGRKAFSQTVNAGTKKVDVDLDKAGISRGVYMVRLDNGMGQHTEKLVVR